VATGASAKVSSPNCSVVPIRTVVALVRDPSHETSQSLDHLHKAEGSRLIVEKYDAPSTNPPFDAIKALESAHNIQNLDVVMANSDIITQCRPVASAKVSELESHFRINAVAPILLFQATLPLLQKSPNPKFFTISSSAGSIATIPDLPLDAVTYGMLKAAVNFAMRKLHFENPGVVVQPFCRGWVKAAMG
jgi:norsolorinic acid ketoreductase